MKRDDAANAVLQILECGSVRVMDAGRGVAPVVELIFVDRELTTAREDAARFLNAARVLTRRSK